MGTKYKYIQMRKCDITPNHTKSIRNHKVIQDIQDIQDALWNVVRLRSISVAATGSRPAVPSVPTQWPKERPLFYHQILIKSAS